MAMTAAVMATFARNLDSRKGSIAVFSGLGFVCSAVGGRERRFYLQSAQMISLRRENIQHEARATCRFTKTRPAFRKILLILVPVMRTELQSILASASMQIAH